MIIYVDISKQCKSLYKKATLFKHFKYNLIMGTETKQQANPKAIGPPEPKIKDNLSRPGVFMVGTLPTSMLTGGYEICSSNIPSWRRVIRSFSIL